MKPPRRTFFTFFETCELDEANTRNFLAKKYPCSKKVKNVRRGGFTLLELMVSLAIFAFMTAFLLAKYGTFNQSVLLTDLAYDTAITIRNAQGTALDVQGTEPTGPVIFVYAYGVHFGGSTPTNQFIYFSNTATWPAAPSAVYSGLSQIISTYTMKPGDVISAICVQSSSTCVSVSTLDVAFQRPNPDAIITAFVSGATSTYPYADITVSANDGETRDIVIRNTGEISVSN